ASIKKWQENLVTYESLQPVVVVPAHGKLIDVSIVRRYRAYFAAVQSQTAAARRGGASVEAASSMLSEGIAKEFADLGPPKGAAGRVGAAIQAAYREAPYPRTPVTARLRSAHCALAPEARSSSRLLGGALGRWIGAQDGPRRSRSRCTRSCSAAHF